MFSYKHCGICNYYSDVCKSLWKILYQLLMIKKVCTTIIFRFGLTSDFFKGVNEESLTRQESLGLPD